MNHIMMMRTMNIWSPIEMIQIPMMDLNTFNLMTTMKHVHLMSLLKHIFFQEFYGNKTNYEPPEVSPHGTNMKREWSVPGSRDYSIQTIPTMMP